MLKKSLMGSQKIKMRLLPALVLIFLTSSLLMYAVPSQVALAAGTVTGTVYRDYNANGQLGVREPGMPGVTVTAYDDANAVVGTATTAANGTYTLNFTGAGTRVRLEFTGLPTGVQYGPFGTQAGTSVQFANAGATNANLGVNRPSDYCQAVPQLASCVLKYANSQDPGNSGTPAVGIFPYTAGTPANAAVDLPAPTVLANVGQVGSIFGMANQRVSNSLFLSAFQKRHSSYGPSDSTGTIYRVNRSAALPNAGTFVDLNTLFGAGTAGVNPHPNATADFFKDPASFDAVGKISLGGMAIDEENDVLYVMNLADRRLYKLPIGTTPTPPAAAAVTRVATPATPPGCTAAGDVRPFAVKMYQGLVYIGMVCSAQSTTTQTAPLPYPNGNPALLQAYVYSFNPATDTFSAAPVFQTPLNYVRGCGNDLTTAGCQTNRMFAAAWQPWTNTFDPLHHKTGPTVGVYPQPMLTDLAFDNGNLILGIRDRYGDMQGNEVGRPDLPGNITTWSSVASGDILRACGTPGAWTLEANATCGGITTAGDDNPQGPSVNEYYFQDDFPAFHQEVSLGGLTQIPGFPDVVSTVYDPDRANGTYDGGTRTYFNDNSTGAGTAGTINRQYRLYNGNGGDPLTFGKANGMSEVTEICNAAPIEIGNRVWNDANANGIQDPSEVVIAGVTVLLFQGATQVGTTTTDANGQYLFNNTNVNAPIGLLPNTVYQVRIATAQAPLAGLGLTISDFNSGANFDVRDSDGAIAGANAVINVTTGRAGFNDHTLDFGFAPLVSLGNLVWNDANNDGFFNNAEVAIAGVIVNLYRDSNTNGICEVATDTLAGTTTTTANTTDPLGNYLFNNLATGSYCVELPNSNFIGAGPLVGFTSSSGTPNSAIGPFEPAPAASPNNDVNNDDDGTFTAGQGITSRVVTLQSSTEPTTDGDASTNSNLTLDFGVFAGAALGDLVWNDVNRNGILDGGEVGVPGVTATLYDTGTNLPVGAPLVTNVTGNYLFTNLNAGQYYVIFTNLPGGFVFSPQDQGGNDAVDSDANITTGRTGNYTLANNQTDLTVDAGINQPAATVSLGNLVWNDLNNNGLYDAGTETAIAGVTVNLYQDTNANGVCEPGTDTQVGASQTTTANAADPLGNYRFNNIPVGSYCVELPQTNFVGAGALAGFTSSTGTNGSATGPFEPAPAASPNNDLNNTDDGTLVAGNGVRSNVIALTVGGEPVDDGGNGDGDNDSDTNLSLDFGVFQPAALGDLVWNDVNRNGILDGGELGVPNVTATLFDIANTPIGTPLLTNATGNYLFTNLTAGTYYVIFTNLPGGFVFSPQDQGGNDAVDSDANITTGRTGNYILTAGQTDLTVDAGINQPAVATLSLGNLVWNDLNNNGLFDAGTETAIAGVTVNLYRDTNTNGVCEPGTDTQVGAGGTTTGGAIDPAGNYSFVGLPAGAYCVHLPETNFAVGSPLNGFNSSTGTNGNASGPFEPAGSPDNNTNNNDDGTRAAGNGILSGIINLTVGGEPTTDGDTDANTNLTLDFGVFRPASLGDLVWTDTNRNGIFETGETGVQNATATLFQQGNATALASQSTNAAGNYLFTNLSAGTYYVVFSTIPTGFVFSPVDQGANDAVDSDANVISGQTGNYTLAAGDNNLTVDAGINQPITPLASLGNFVWLDQDRDGIQDTNEPGVSGVLVQLFDGAGAQLATLTTDVNGNYLFSSLQPGTYSVGFTVPSIYTLTLQTQGADTAVDSNPDRITGRTAQVTLAAGENNLTIDAGVYQLSGLGDFVWADNNGNGIQDPGEPGIVGVVVNLYDQAGNLIATTTTNTSGNYSFVGLPAGTYTIGFVPPAGYVVSPPAQGGDSTVDSNPDPVTGRTPPIVLAPGEFNPTIDAGLFQSVSLGNLVWNDINNNGLLDAGEPGLANVVVNLYRDSNGNGTFEAGTDAAAGTVNTNATGNYLFANLSPGSYLVQVAQSNFVAGSPLAGFTTSTGTNGSLTGPYEPAGSPNNDIDNNDDGSALATQGLTSRAVTLQPGVEPINDGDTNPNSNLTVDFGLFQPASVGDFVWNDGNRNGNQDPNEPGVPGVIVTIYATGSTTPIGTITIGPDGSYLFTNLTPGSYYLIFSSLPTGFTFTGQDRGGNDATDSDANPISGRTGDVSLAPGETNRTVDAGLIQPTAPLASLGDFVWRDANRNGIQDAGEMGVPSVRVDLYDAAGNSIANTNTDVNGGYAFVNLQPGTYSVGFALPSGFSFSPQNQGGNTAVDSNADVNTGRTGSITLAAGENNLTIDAGIYQPTVTTPTPVPSTPVPSTPVPSTPVPSTPLPGQPTFTPSPTREPGLPTPTPTPMPEPSLPIATPVDTTEPFITKSVDVTKAGVGQTVKFTITVNNQTSSEASEIIVMDNVPASFIVQGATSTQGKVTIDGQNVSVEVGTVPSGGTVTIIVTTIIAPGATGDVTNRVNMMGKMVGGRSFGGMGAGGSSNTTSTAGVSISIPGVPNTGMANVGYDFNWLMLVVAIVMMLVGGRLLIGNRKTNRQQ